MNAIRQRTARGRPPATDPTGPATEDELWRSYAARPETVPRVRDEFAAFADRHGATEEQVDEVRLLVSEAATNVIRHAYRDKAGRVYAMAAVAAGRVSIRVADDGVGPHARSPNPGAGWGWALIAAVSEQFTVRRRRNGGTEVEMHLHLGPGLSTTG
jgi:anti-sigma regulatory factor (Ser/Thr protein kinase)